MKVQRSHIRGKPYQSKLIPFAEIIRHMRRQRKTYIEIARFLQVEKGIYASPSTIFSFVKVRTKKRHLVAHLDEPAEKVVSRPAGPVAAGNDAVEALKRRRTATDKKKLFTFDETKPLTLNH